MEFHTPTTRSNAEAGGSGLEAGMLVGGGRYQLERVLGHGGMGQVWLALDSRLGEQVALKFLPPEIRGDPVALDDMRRETLKSHRLTHPNIIRIHDLFESPDETPFITMEYINGQNLHELRKEQPDGVFNWIYLRPIVQQLCEALHYAHEEKVIHRDLKPANMVLDARGRLRLADFGIAAMAGDSAQREAQRHPTSGTLTHMSPQQMQGKPPHVTDDIYALGATLYELLTGKPPFHTGDILGQVQNTPATPLRDRLWELAIENPVPDDVAALIMACLAKDPAQRPQSAADIGAWLGLTARSVAPPPPAPVEPKPAEPVPASVEIPEPRPARAPLLLIVLGLAAIGFAVWKGWELLRPAALHQAWSEPALWQPQQESTLPSASQSLPFIMNQGGTLRAATFDFGIITNQPFNLVAGSLRWLSSTDGQSWQMLKAGFQHGTIQWIYEAETSTSHALGSRDGDGWLARGGRGHMVFGPYRKFPAGDYRAVFRLLTDRIQPPTDGLGYVDVSRNSGHSIVIRGVRRGDFRQANVYQDIELRYRCEAEDALEFRTHIDPGGVIKQDKVTITVAAGAYKSLDRVTLGSVYHDGAQWYYVYQGKPPLQGAICLATSMDGETFRASPDNAILRPSAKGWDSVHVGAPVLHREDGRWYLFYTGYDGKQTALGVASGSSLNDLQRNPQPILKPSGDTNRWDASGFGRISQILEERGVFYAAAEAWSDRAGTPEWRVGMIQSTNLLNWSVAPTPVTGNMDFRASSPSLLSIGGKTVLYVQREGVTNASAPATATLTRLEVTQPR